MNDIIVDSLVQVKYVTCLYLSMVAEKFCYWLWEILYHQLHWTDFQHNFLDLLFVSYLNAGCSCIWWDWVRKDHTGYQFFTSILWSLLRTYMGFFWNFHDIAFMLTTSFINLIIFSFFNMVQVPQYLLDHMWGKGEACKIVCTQPRRISAISGLLSSLCIQSY